MGEEAGMPLACGCSLRALLTVPSLPERLPSLISKKEGMGPLGISGLGSPALPAPQLSGPPDSHLQPLSRSSVWL